MPHPEGHLRRAPGVEEVRPGVYRVTVRLASSRGDKRITFTLRLGEKAGRLREISEEKEGRLRKLRSDVARVTLKLDDSQDPEQTIIVSTAENRLTKTGTLVAGAVIAVLLDNFPRLDEMFDYRRVKSAFAEVASCPPQEIIDHLVRAGEQWMQDAVQDDDITMLVIRRTTLEDRQ